jgi:signal transduction histidine kinase
MSSKASDPGADALDVPRRYHRLGPRLVLATLVASSLGLVATSVHTIWSERETLSEQLDARGQSLVKLASVACLEPLLGGDYPGLQTFVEGLATGRTDVVFARIERPDGQLVREATNEVGRVRHVGSAIKEYQALIVAPEAGGTRDRNLGRIILGISTQSLDDLEWVRARDLLLQAAVSFAALALAMSFFLRRAVARPISSLDAQASALARGELDAPIVLENDDEFGRLAETLESMRRSLRSSYNELRTNNEELQRAGSIRDQALGDLENALARANEASEAKSTFLTTMSHEIRTPMNGVIGNASLLLQTSLDAEQREFADTIRSSAESLRLLVDEVLDFSKLESGKITVQIADTDLRNVIQDTLSFLRPSAEAKNLALHEYVDADVPLRVRTDALRVRQILINLVGNAIKFTDEGSVTLKVGVDGREEGFCALRIAVLDTGIGVPKEARAQLFQPFTQADSSLSRRHEGTGLGLAICKRLVGLLGGEIGFESAPGSGSLFWFTLRVEERVPTTSFVPRPALPSPSVPKPRARQRADPAGRGQPGEPAPGAAHAAPRRLSGRAGRERRRGARQAVEDRLRADPDGLQHAGHGRLRGHASHPRARVADRTARADRGPDRQRDAGRPRALPRRGHGRVPRQARHGRGAAQEDRLRRRAPPLSPCRRPGVTCAAAAPASGPPRGAPRATRARRPPRPAPGRAAGSPRARSSRSGGWPRSRGRRRRGSTRRTGPARASAGRRGSARRRRARAGVRPGRAGRCSSDGARARAPRRRA